MVKQPTAGFFVGGSNPGRANMVAAPPPTVDQPRLEPPTEKSGAFYVTIQPKFVATAMCLPTAWSLLSTNF